MLCRRLLLLMNIIAILPAALAGSFAPRTYTDADRCLLNPAIGENRVVLYGGSLPADSGDDLVTIRFGGESEDSAPFVCSRTEDFDSSGGALQRAASARLAAAYSQQALGWCTGMKGGGEFCPGKSVTVDFLRAEPVGKPVLYKNGSVYREYDTPGMNVKEYCQCDRDLKAIGKEDFDFGSLCVPGRKEKLDDGTVATILRTSPGRNRYEILEEDEDGTSRKRALTYSELADLGFECSGDGMSRKYFKFADVGLRPGATVVTTESVACCPSTYLGPPDQALTTLLAPLAGTCLHYASGERVWEYCHPFNLRLVQGLTPDKAWSIDLMQSVESIQYDHDKREVVVEGTGESLSTIQLDLFLEIPGRRHPIKAAGGIFNPPRFFNLTAVPIAVPADSRNGCDAFEAPAAAKLAQRRGIPWMAVARRGGCFFQNKTMNAEAAGASGSIVINSKEGAMVRWMDGVPDADLPLIPTALVGHEADFLMDYNSPTADETTTSDLRQITLTKPGPADEKVHSRIAFVCDEALRNSDVKATSTCSPGDGVTLNRPAEAARPAIVREVMGGGMLKVDTIRDDGVTGWKGRLIHSGYVYKSPGRPCVVVGGNVITDAAVGEQGVVDVRIHSELLCSHPAMLKPWHKE
ncbi:hypothetical protein FOL47_000909 [Perkinsus chesapeaki]|uniref:PA domain-containing protein n=1 Tax=Perkinsus chesapeaki TaxID=330153 RepID=A0A7J6N3K3_PERCH|nr:hypothetical protein FOL47_000909 [Perkinsus chesapeaki]